MFIHPIRVGLGDTDAAGILFFPSLQRMAQTVFETWLEEHGYSLRAIFESGEWLCPVVHAESDFMKPLRVGDHLGVHLGVAQIGRSSFATEYRFERGGETAATVRLVHVVIDRRSHTATPIPDEFRKLLEGDIAGH